MEVVILIGIQAAGKTTFYHERFANTHARVSLDVVRNREREQALVKRHLTEREPFVVDNTNVTRADRARYIAAANAAGCRVIGYYFPTDPKQAFARNRKRPGKENIPAGGLFGTAKRLQPPTLDEGFDELHVVELVAPSGFKVS
jgi:predicted kinase